MICNKYLDSMLYVLFLTSAIRRGTGLLVYKIYQAMLLEKSCAWLLDLIAFIFECC